VNKLIIILLPLLLGCATPHYVKCSQTARKIYPKDNTCFPQALYVSDCLGGETWGNSKHAWTIWQGKMYDSTDTWFDERPIDDKYVVRYYGDKSTWVKFNGERWE